ncbi:BolA/IbaG family iron-sulfur metabolism protein [archaeon]|jgi:acid stress-induced BolA-like protein IbaG/YrbA|nr:BolA/IbaG family iron-sulfur metabolism protein [archaeon]MBT6698107.1 BolA/IbaG family iron-sulfur metabolism protein [archaeon]
MLTLNQIKQQIESKLSNSTVEILDPRKDGVHLKAVVTCKDFEGKGLVEQHQMVYATVKDLINSGELHALGIETKTK